MKKKVIIGVICGVVVVAIIVAIVVVMVMKKNDDSSSSSKKSENSTNTSASNSTKKDSNKDKDNEALEAMAEDLADALKSEKDMEKFIDKHIDYKVYSALDTIEDPTEEIDEKAFKKAIKDADDIDTEEIKEEVLEAAYEYVQEDKEYKFVSLGDEKDFVMIPILKCHTAEYKDEDGEKAKFVFVTYDDSLVLFVSEEEMLMLEGIMNMSRDMGSDISDQMSQQEVDIYNANVKQYLGDGIKGSEVKSMLESIISQNQANVEDEGKFIAVFVDEISNFDEADDLKDICREALNDNSEDNVSEATDAIKGLKSKINSAKNYSVEADYGDKGKIESVTITEE